MRNTIIFSLILLFLIFNFACQRPGSEKSAVDPASKAEPAPDFRVSSLDGQELSLSALKGKIILVNFWATWCPPCRAEIPDFIEAYEELKGRGLEILGFSVDTLPENELKNFVARARINYPVALVGEDTVSAFRPGQYIPVSIFIDKKGYIRYRHVGRLTKKDLVSIFETLEKE
ncbi:MAG: TlpA disulfide reductase family protein [Candidatus Saccharicenans sp.]|nr:TlpA disulfide reductase family protein [Candidatus Saccharicenans sp.]